MIQFATREGICIYNNVLVSGCNTINANSGLVCFAKYDNGSYIQYWQPIEQQYGLGYIALGADGLKNDHFCSSETFFPEMAFPVFTSITVRASVGSITMVAPEFK